MRTQALRTAASRRGLTLLELLMVMTVIGIVFGLGIGALSTMDLGRGADAEALRGALRSARASALAERHPAAVDVVTDPETQRTSLVVRRMRTLGTWHFESPDGRGTDGLTASPVKGATQIDDGFVGRALHFSGRERDARAEIALETKSAYDVRDGFSIDLVVRLDSTSGGTVFRLGKRTRICGLEVVEGGGLLGFVVPLYSDSTGRELQAGRVDLKLPPGTLEAGRWIRLTLAYDGAQLRLFVDGFLSGVVDVQGPLPRIDEPLVLGGEPVPFPGAIDSLVLRGVDVSEPLPLSQNAEWPAELPRRIQFDADGSLDVLIHGGLPLELVLPSEPDEPVFVGRLGVVQ
ncbi:hypothetical protein Pla163_09870 [Planctomycetes bacterium Pla163]|uniref:Prepilin-type N-terminal cleavage/methylation domain-containing protein n=1 Tax=Rohdeia mirabilis TaxID=2528008 RepID=A0A518CXF5_9BACT|nr:hypothetical protein Pla163_09870 [Planctomycetes bacterium Pla163]